MLTRRHGAAEGWVGLAALVCAATAVIGHTVLVACTGFCAVGNGQVLVGNNEDWNNPRTKIWFIPAAPGSYGRVYVGFDDLSPQGGMNERGLWFDGFATPPIGTAAPSDLPAYPGNITDAAMKECATVDDVVRLFSRYDRSFLREAVLMFADATGDAVSIERKAMVRKTGPHFVQTNFHQSRPRPGADDGRFTTAADMLERAGEGISVDLFRRILAATHQTGGYPTLYSNVYDLRSRTMSLYYFHDFDHVVTFDLARELAKGEHVLDIPALFPRNAAADAFAARSAQSLAPGQDLGFVLIALPLALIGAALFAVVRGGKRVRVTVSAVAGTIGILVAVVIVALQTHRQASPQWMEFSIGPAAGDSASIQSNTMRADGITLKAAVATAYEIPAVRVLGPAWLTDTRYSINAVAGIDASDSFRALLKEELKNRLGLETHVEARPFDVLVLTATGTPRLERAPGHSVSMFIHSTDAQFQNASMEDVASALQIILGKPVFDETGITGSYTLEFAWGTDRAATVTAALRDRFGLKLSPSQRDMDALIIDGIRRDPALVLLAQAGRLTRAAPRRLRRQIAGLLTIH